MHRAILNGKQLPYVIIVRLVVMLKLKKYVYICFCFQCYMKCVMGMMQSVS